MMLGNLREKQLYVKLSKCKLRMKEVQFLGHLILIEGISMDLWVLGLKPEVKEL